jgi:hypothetical protein
VAKLRSKNSLEEIGNGWSAPFTWELKELKKEFLLTELSAVFQEP